MRRIVFAGLLGLGVVLIPVAPQPVAAGGGCHAPESETAGDTVELRGNCFTPTILRIQPGTTVNFVNRDGLAHVVAGVSWGVADMLEPAASAKHRFDSAGTYPYSCYLHAGMNGVVVVGDGVGAAPPVDVTPVRRVASSSPAEESADGWWPEAIGATLIAALAFGFGWVSRRRTSAS